MLRIVCICGGLCLAAAWPAASAELFDDPLFRRCYNWMTQGKGGALIDNLCIDLYGLPPPTLFICARNIQDGFSSAVEQKTCELVFEEYARKSKNGHVR
jgi:hypothetical protein